MPIIYGHRGAKGEAPENTLCSFQHCLAQGVTRCELDLRLAQDGVLMVFHDATLKRTTGQTGTLAASSSTELSQLDASVNFNRAYPQAATPPYCPIPTLEQLFQQCAFEHWQLEIKGVARAQAKATVLAVKHLVERYQLTEQVTLTSASHQVLRAALQWAPELSRGCVVEWRWQDPLAMAKRYDCELLALNWKLCTPRLVERSKAKGLHLSLWTVNEPKQMLRLANMGVDSLITDFPGLASATLGSR